MVAKPVIFVCTPELVNSWLFYPAWFCRADIIPCHIIMDYKDVDRCHKEALLRSATPYDYIVSDTLNMYEYHNFLLYSTTTL